MLTKNTTVNMHQRYLQRARQSLEFLKEKVFQSTKSLSLYYHLEVKYRNVSMMESMTE